jgi:hypothetical protein
MYSVAGKGQGSRAALGTAASGFASRLPFQLQLMKRKGFYRAFPLPYTSGLLRHERPEAVI